MSSETILPPEGPEGPKKQLQEETNPLLFKSTGERRDFSIFEILIHMYITEVRIVFIVLNVYFGNINDELYVCIGAVTINGGCIFVNCTS